MKKILLSAMVLIATSTLTAQIQNPLLIPPTLTGSICGRQPRKVKHPQLILQLLRRARKYLPCSMKLPPATHSRRRLGMAMLLEELLLPHNLKASLVSSKNHQAVTSASLAGLAACYLFPAKCTLNTPDRFLDKQV